MISRPEAINQFLGLFNHPHYLEIGVSRGETFLAINAERKVAVDPKFLFPIEQAKRAHGRSEFYEVTSDIYFGSLISPSDVFQVIYLDGLHTFEQTLRDFTNAIQFISPDGVIVIDDVVPNSYKAALPNEADSVMVKEFTGDPDHSWMGDTYKLVFFIEAFFPTFELRTIAENHGQAVVWRANRPRKKFKTYSAKDIAGLEFLDVIRNADIFRRKSCAEIVEEVRHAQHASVPMPQESASLDVLQRPQRKVLQSGAELTRCSLDSLAVERITLSKAVSHSLPACLVYENISEFNRGFAHHMKRDIYSARVASIKAIDLIRLETATVHPSADFMVTVGAYTIDEQVPPWFGQPMHAMIAAGWPIEEINGETVIVGRYGIGTWGHWLCELLPKIVMVEAAFPGRFRFVVPQTGDEPQWQNFRDSISAYGILSDRLVLLEAGKSFRLRQPWGVTPVWSDYVMHPRAAAVMRCALPQTPVERGRKIALLRQRGAARMLVNWEEIAAFLSAKGYEIVDIAALNFRDQVQAFCEASDIFSTLGSGLSGLLYSQIGVRVLSVAPHIFGDRFFYALVAERHGQYADVRGPIVTPDPIIPHRGSFSIDADRVAAGLTALR